MIHMYIFIILYTVHFFSKCHGILTDLFVFFCTKNDSTSDSTSEAVHLFTPQRCGCSRWLFGLQQCNNLHICELQETGRVLMRCCVGNVAYEGRISGSTWPKVGQFHVLMEHQQLLSELSEVTCGEVIEFPPKTVETSGNMWSSTKQKSAEQELCL